MWIWIILGMSLATLIPRWLPVWLVDRWELPAWFRGWLQAIPFAALGALIFPGILTVDPQEPLVGVAGGLVAVLLAWFRLPILVIIIGAVGTVLVFRWW